MGGIETDLVEMGVGDLTLLLATCSLLWFGRVT